MVFIGIDPGISGALAVYNSETKNISFIDTPTVSIKVGKSMKNQMNIPAVVNILRALADGGDCFATIEKVQAMPGSDGQGGRQSMGATSAFSFGMGFGIWQGILAALLIPYTMVHPATWKSVMMQGCTKEKDASRVRAMQLFPYTSGDLNLKKHHGRADALLIAAWACKMGAKPIHVEEKELEPSLF